jgi:hypothetical protein
MKVTNENQLRGCVQEVQVACVSLTQAIVGIETCAVPRSPREAQVFRLLSANTLAINLLLSLIELTGPEDEPSWPTN